MLDFEEWGWTKTGAQGYRHHCGARVTMRGKLWSAKTVAGDSAGRHVTAFQAVTYLHQNDPSFWSYGKFASFGDYAGIAFPKGCSDRRDEDNVFICYLAIHRDFPEFLQGTFKKVFVGKATCVRCLHPMDEWRMRDLREFRFSNGRLSTYIVCGCGYPVWRLGSDAFGIATSAIASAIRSWRRKVRRKDAGGKHSPEEIQEILAIQGGRCIYCNVRFTKRVLATKDHLLAVRQGGADWSLNLMMACRICNSRRCDIPFRTYCKLLSPTQNKRILKHISNRILALDFEGLNSKALISFMTGLAAHEPSHWRLQRYTRSTHDRATKCNAESVAASEHCVEDV